MFARVCVCVCAGLFGVYSHPHPPVRKKTRLLDRVRVPGDHHGRRLEVEGHARARNHPARHHHPLPHLPPGVSEVANLKGAHSRGLRGERTGPTALGGTLGKFHPPTHYVPEGRESHGDSLSSHLTHPTGIFFATHWLTHKYLYVVAAMTDRLLPLSRMSGRCWLYEPQ